MAGDRKRTRAQRRRERAEGRRTPRPRGGDEGSTPAPDPLEGATPYVDEARMAEEGVEVPSPDADEPGGEGPFADELEYEREVAAAPDQLEGDLAAPGRAHAGPAGQPTRRKRGRFITFLGHCVDELRRVQWPDRRQVGQGTAVTLGFVVIAGGYLGLMDAIWKPLVEAIL
jgi:preprotein translocase SecE subunit